MHVFGASLVVSVTALVLGWIVFNRLSKGFFLHV
jgi:hypothetical protein